MLLLLGTIEPNQSPFAHTLQHPTTKPAALKHYVCFLLSPCSIPHAEHAALKTNLSRSAQEHVVLQTRDENSQGRGKSGHAMLQARDKKVRGHVVQCVLCTAECFESKFDCSESPMACAAAYQAQCKHQCVLRAWGGVGCYADAALQQREAHDQSLAPYAITIHQPCCVKSNCVWHSEC
eukprot:1156472-Pelagomonas_calceolata.AAC.4